MLMHNLEQQLQHKQFLSKPEHSDEKIKNKKTQRDLHFEFPGRETLTNFTRQAPIHSFVNNT